MTPLVVQKYLLFILPILFAFLGPYTLSDLGIWLEWGHQMVSQKTLWTTESRSVLSTLPPEFQSWSLSLLYYALFKLGGIFTVIYFHHVMILIIFYLIYNSSLFKSPSLQFSTERYFIYLCFLGMIPSLVERPSLVALIPLLLSLNILTKTKLPNKDYLSLILLNIIWTNMHGSSFLLLFMWGWKTLIERTPKKLGFLVILFLTTLLNPFGFKIYTNLLQTIALSRTRGLDEWDSLYQGKYLFILIELMILAIMTIVFYFRKRPEFIQNLHHPFLPLLILGFTALRNSSLPFVALLPYLSQMGFFRVQEREPRKDIKLTVVAVAFTVFAIFLLPPFKHLIAPYLPEARSMVLDKHTVKAIAEKIKETNTTCPVFNNWNYGSALLVTIPNKIFLDSRNVIYKQKDFEEYSNFTDGVGVESYLERYYPCLFVLDEAKDGKLIHVLKSQFSATEMMKEKGAVLIRR